MRAEAVKAEAVRAVARVAAKAAETEVAAKAGARREVARVAARVEAEALRV